MNAKFSITHGIDFFAIKPLIARINTNRIERIAILLRNQSLLQIFRHYLGENVSHMAGVYFFTPESLREELCKRNNLPCRVLPSKFLIPMEKDYSQQSLNELQQLRPQERQFMCADITFKKFEQKNLMTEAALDEMLLRKEVNVSWDFAYSFAFSEGDWNHFSLLQAFSRASNEVLHCFQKSPNCCGVSRWRKTWNYDMELEQSSEHWHTNKKLSRRFVITDNENDAMSLLCGKVVEIAINELQQSQSSKKIAIAFAGSNGYANAVRRKLDEVRISTWNLVGNRKETHLPPLQWHWLQYQKRQKRRECIELLRASAIYGKIPVENLADFIAIVIAFCRKNMCDDCGEELCAVNEFWWHPLPQNAEPMHFFNLLCEDFPENYIFKSIMEQLACGYDALHCCAFLDFFWELCRETETHILPCEGPATPVHLISAFDLPAQLYDYVVFADCAEDDLLNINLGEFLSDESCTQMNGSMDDFYYTPPNERILLREWQLLKLCEGADHASAIFAAKKFTKSGNQKQCLAPVFLQCFCESHRQSFMSNEILDAITSLTQCANMSIDETVAMPIYSLRRDCTQMFGIYDFGFGNEDMDALAATIPCKAWELALKSPENAWLEHVLHIRKIANSIFEELPHLLGTAVHEQLAARLLGKQGGVIFPQNRDWVRAITCQCEGYINDLWRQIEKIRTISHCEHECVEFPIEGLLPIGQRKIELHGRVDWLLLGEKQAKIAIDFKTGSSAKAFTISNLQSGNFLQLALYGLLLAEADECCLMQALFPFSRPKSLQSTQLQAEHDESLKNFWEFFSDLYIHLNFGYRPTSQWNTPFIAHCRSPIADEIIESRMLISGFPGRSEEKIS